MKTAVGFASSGALLLFGFAALSAACSSVGSFCDSSRTSPCPNDAVQTSQDRQNCHDAVAKEGACSQAYSDYFSCAYSHAICDAKGKLDRAKTLGAASASCSSQYANYETCKAQQVADGGV